MQKANIKIKSLTNTPIFIKFKSFFHFTSINSLLMCQVLVKEWIIVIRNYILLALWCSKFRHIHMAETPIVIAV